MLSKTRLEFNWCVPVSGDGFYLGLPVWELPPTLEYTVQIFKAAERFGFRYLLIGMGFNNHILEAWTLATAALALTSQAGAMVAVRPGFYSAPVLAKMAVTLDQIRLFYFGGASEMAQEVSAEQADVYMMWGGDGNCWQLSAGSRAVVAVC